MILPNKHLNFSESLLGLGAYILKNIDSAKSIDTLWDKYKSDFENNLYFAKHSFDNLVLAVIFLSLVGAADEKDGEIIKCD